MSAASMKKIGAGLVCVLVALATTGVRGEGAAAVNSSGTVASAAAATASRLLEQKRSMVERLLLDSPVVKRIAESGNAEAKRHLALSRDLYDNAHALLREGRETAAEAMLNEAIWQIGRGRQLVPDPLAQAVEDRIRFGQLQESIASVRVSLRAHVERERTRRGSKGAPEAEKVAALLDAAGILGEGERIAEANRLLDEALTLLLHEWQRQAGGRAVVYSRSFPRAEDEYTFELERNRSYETLVPIAVTEFRPTADALTQIDRMVEQNRMLRARAEREAMARNLKGAIQTLQGGTDALQKALQTAGLDVPQTLD